MSVSALVYDENLFESSKELKINGLYRCVLEVTRSRGHEEVRWLWIDCVYMIGAQVVIWVYLWHDEMFRQYYPQDSLWYPDPRVTEVLSCAIIWNVRNPCLSSIAWHRCGLGLEVRWRCASFGLILENQSIETRVDVSVSLRRLASGWMDPWLTQALLWIVTKESKQNVGLGSKYKYVCISTEDSEPKEETECASSRCLLGLDWIASTIWSLGWCNQLCGRRGRLTSRPYLLFAEYKWLCSYGVYIVHE